MVKYKILLKRLANITVTVALISTLHHLWPFQNLSIGEIAVTIVLLFILPVLFLTALLYWLYARQIDKGKKKESDFLFRWEKKS